MSEIKLDSEPTVNKSTEQSARVFGELKSELDQDPTRIGVRRAIFSLQQSWGVKTTLERSEDEISRIAIFRLMADYRRLVPNGFFVPHLEEVAQTDNGLIMSDRAVAEIRVSNDEIEVNSNISGFSFQLPNITGASRVILALINLERSERIRAASHPGTEERRIEQERRLSRFQVSNRETYF